jgi:hypothetical protein
LSRPTFRWRRCLKAGTLCMPHGGAASSLRDPPPQLPRGRLFRQSRLC